MNYTKQIWEGSDDWIRSKFNEYLTSFLNLARTIPHIGTENPNLLDLKKLSEFGLNWAKPFLKTSIFQNWFKNVGPLSEDSINFMHPSGPLNISSTTEYLKEFSSNIST